MEKQDLSMRIIRGLRPSFSELMGEKADYFYDYDKSMCELLDAYVHQHSRNDQSFAEFLERTLRVTAPVGAKYDALTDVLLSIKENENKV